MGFFLFLEQPSESKELDLQFSLEDLETMKVIGKGSGGLVQLVRHKWVGTLFALKVLVEVTISTSELQIVKNAFSLFYIGTRYAVISYASEKDSV